MIDSIRSGDSSCVLREIFRELDRSRSIIINSQDRFTERDFNKCWNRRVWTAQRGRSKRGAVGKMVVGRSTVFRGRTN